jgi:hypothetical protein
MKITVFWDDSVHFCSNVWQKDTASTTSHALLPQKGTSSTFLQNAYNHLPDTVMSNTNVNLHGNGNFTHDIL